MDWSRRVNSGSICKPKDSLAPRERRHCPLERGTFGGRRMKLVLHDEELGLKVEWTPQALIYFHSTSIILLLLPSRNL